MLELRLMRGGRLIGLLVDCDRDADKKRQRALRRLRRWLRPHTGDPMGVCVSLAAGWRRAGGCESSQERRC